MTIEAGQLRAWGMIWTDEDAESPTGDAGKQTKITATAVIDGEEVTKDAGSLGELKLGDEVKLTVDLIPDAPPRHGEASMPVIELEAGSTTTATIRIDRRDFKDRVGFGSDHRTAHHDHSSDRHQR